MWIIILGRGVTSIGSCTVCARKQNAERVCFSWLGAEREDRRKGVKTVQNGHRNRYDQNPIRVSIRGQVRSVN